MKAEFADSQKQILSLQAQILHLQNQISALESHRIAQPVIDELKNFYKAADFLFDHMDILESLDDFFEKNITPIGTGNTKIAEVFKVLNDLENKVYDKHAETEF